MARRKGLVLAVLLATAAAMLGLTTSPVSAATGCTENPGHWFAGYISSDGSDYGTQARLVTQQTSLCTTTDGSYATDATEWVMLGTDNPYSYAQAGYYRDFNYATPYFWAESRVNGNPQFYVDYLDPPPAIGSTHLYTVQYIASKNVEYEGYDYTALLSTTIPFGTGDWVNRNHQYFGEIHDTGSDIYGNVNNQVLFSYLAVQQPYHTCCQIVTQTLYLGAGKLAKFHVSSVAYDGFSTYD